jgi:DNA-binding MarR family transcriptional regulator/GNAT superfamily N-acetyltransferase
MVVDVLRRFNRSYTQRIGVLDDSYLHTGRALGPSRLLFEVSVEGSTVLELRRRLGLDSGYVSRMLRQLEGDGLVTVAAVADDRRQRKVQLTKTGVAERGKLERRAQARARQLVAPLSDRQRNQLANALTTADRLLRAATVDFDLVNLRTPEARWAIGEYFAELDERFPTGFDADSARDEGAEADALGPPDGAFVVVRADGVAIGCGGVQRLDERAAEIKRMWIHPEWRGLELGRRLLAHLEQFAADRGHTSVMLDTNDSLTEAIAMYQAMGYTPIERYNDNPYAQRWFAKPLAGLLSRGQAGGAKQR